MPTNVILSDSARTAVYNQTLAYLKSRIDRKQIVGTCEAEDIVNSLFLDFPNNDFEENKALLREYICKETTDTVNSNHTGDWHHKAKKFNVDWLRLRLFTDAVYKVKHYARAVCWKRNKIKTNKPYAAKYSKGCAAYQFKRRHTDDVYRKKTNAANNIRNKKRLLATKFQKSMLCIK